MIRLERCSGPAGRLQLELGSVQTWLVSCMGARHRLDTDHVTNVENELRSHVDSCICLHTTANHNPVASPGLALPQMWQAVRR